MDVRKIGIIGAGQMGTGIAQVSAVAGLDVHLMDIAAVRIDEALDAIRADIGRLVEKGRLPTDAEQTALGRISTTTALEGFGDCDLVVEAATEDEQIKREIYKDLCPMLAEHAILGSNTSSISITRLGAQTDRPNRFLGMHFMNPVPRLELIELIRGIATDEETFSTARALAVRLGKTPVSAEDFPAFIVNRILMPMLNEAIYTLYEGVGSVQAVDTAMRLGTHHPMGPLELADFIGLDTCLGLMHVLHEGLADTKYRPCPLLVKYVEAGWTGRKAGRGFYDYSSDPPEPSR